MVVLFSYPVFPRRRWSRDISEGESPSTPSLLGRADRMGGGLKQASGQGLGAEPAPGSTVPMATSCQAPEAVQTRPRPHIPSWEAVRGGGP